MENFIYSPVRYYSSGMRVRLGFSIAIHLKPDILLLDEVLAVGDIGFKIKSLNAMASLIRETAVIFVSHSVDQIARICSSVCLLENGKVAYLGDDISSGIALYEKTSPAPGSEYIHDGMAAPFQYIHK
ncbi:MAG: ABC transporter ATP-binding protein [Saprospiraceae bacterium]|nr:ABC transporter ATP-binding protein [Saprospiraceae bacterium]